MFKIPAFIILCGTILSTATSAFLPGRTSNSVFMYRRENLLQVDSPSKLGVGDDLFENFKRLWGNTFGEDKSYNGQFSGTDNGDAAGTSLIASIPVQSIKPGGLRLFLMFYLMGMQNTPDRGTWQANQPTSDDYVVEMYYRDSSGMLSIELLEDEIRIRRCGSVPSTPYLMQETVIVDGILDELHQCAFDEKIPIPDRLLVPEPSNAIETAKGSLSFS